MQRSVCFVAAGVFLMAGGLAPGQSLLRQVESQLPGASAAAAPADAAGPGSGYLGMFPDETDLGGKGVRVHSVKQGGPAEAGGLKSGDVITAIDGKALTKLADLDEVLGKAIVGQKLRMTVERNGKMQPVAVTLGVRPPPAAAATTPNPGEAPSLAPPTAPAPLLPDPTPAPQLTLPTPASAPADAPPPPAPAIGAAPAAPEATSPAPGSIRSRPLDLGPPPADQPPVESAPVSPADSLPTPGASAGGGASLGITVVPLTEDARATYRLTPRRGAFIQNIRPGSPADRAGLPIGGVIVSIDGRRVDSPDDLKAAIRGAQPGQEVELNYYEGERLGRKVVKLAPAASATIPAMPSPGPLGLGGSGAGGGIGGTGGDRPLLSRVERMVDNFAGGARGPSTVYNPADVAALQARMMELTQQVQKLEERLRSLESKLAPGAAAPSAPAPAPAAPTFGGGLSAPGTNP